MKALYNTNMRTLLHTGLFSLSLFLILGGFTFSNAQILGSLATVEIALSPEYPQPGKLVEATVSSTSESVRAATIVWLLDGEIQQQEAGGVDFSFVVGDVGSSQTLAVLVKTPGGQVLTKTLTIQPSQVTLLWEANTYTPPFYKGRALYSSSSSISAEAIPYFVTKEGERYDSSELIYTWSKNGTILGDASGINASSLVTSGPKFFGDYILGVEVSSPDGNQLARSAARIKTTDPIIALYEHNPLTGVQYHSAFGSDHSLAGASQVEVQAVPYFMDVFKANDRALEYSWRVNGTEVFGTQDNPSLLSIQLSTNEDIATRIKVTINHALHLLQTGVGDFNVLFVGSARNSLFGL